MKRRCIGSAAIFATALLLLSGDWGTSGEAPPSHPGTVPGELPEILEKALTTYASLRGYRDSTFIDTNISGKSFFSPVSYAFERPNRIRFQGWVPAWGDVMLLCDGKKMYAYNSSLKSVDTSVAPETIAPDVLKYVGAWGMDLLHNILTSGDPVEYLGRNILAGKVAGNDTLDGGPVIRVEVVEPLDSLGLVFPILSGAGSPLKLSFWIGRTDFLIRKIEYRIDEERMLESLGGEERKGFLEYLGHLRTIVTEKHRFMEINPVFPDSVFSPAPSGKGKRD